MSVSISKAWALGSWTEDDPVARAFVQTVAKHVLPVATTRSLAASDEACSMSGPSALSVADAVEQLDETSLVLLRFGLDIATDTFDRIRATGARIIVFLPDGGREIAPARAVEYCRQNVLSVVMWRDTLPLSFARRLGSLFSNRSMYGTLEIKSGNEWIRPKTCFLISAYSQDGDEFQEGAREALGARGIDVISPREIQSGDFLSTKIQDQLRAADLVLADIGDGKAANPNVFYELGYIDALKKRRFIFHRVRQRSGRAHGPRQRPSLPSDLAGSQVFEYWDALDLTMKLFWRLHWVTDHVGA